MSSDLRRNTGCRTHSNVMDLLLLLYVLWSPKEDLLELWHALGQWPPKENLLQTIKESLLSDPLHSCDMFSNLQRKLEDLLSDPFQHNRPTPAFMICPLTAKGRPAPTHIVCPPTSKGRFAVRCTPLLWYVLWPPKEDLLSDPLLSYDMSSDLQRKICCQTHSTPMISPLTSKGRSAIRPVPTPTICPLTSKEELLSDPLLSYDMSSDLWRKICCQTHYSYMSSDLQRKICCQTHSSPICPLTSKGRSAVRHTPLL